MSSGDDVKCGSCYRKIELFSNDDDLVEDSILCTVCEDIMCIDCSFTCDFCKEFMCDGCILMHKSDCAKNRGYKEYVCEFPCLSYGYVAGKSLPNGWKKVGDDVYCHLCVIKGVISSKKRGRYKELELVKNPPPQDSVLKCKRTHNDAVIPFKTHETDAGFDLNLVELKSIKKGIYTYSTGIQIEPPSLKGGSFYYLSLVPRSSMVNTGYMMANSPGIIDESYRGDILVKLIKFNKKAPDIKLPARIIQIIPHIIPRVSIAEYQSLSETNRADGCFGSTNKKQKINNKNK